MSAHFDFLMPMVVSAAIGLMTALSARMRHQVSDGTDIYRYPPYIAWMLVLGFGLALTGIVVLWRETGVWGAAAFSILFAWMFLTSIYVFYFRAIVTESGLTIGTFRRVDIPFGDIVDVEVRAGARSRELVIYARDGRVFRVSGMLADFDDLAASLRTQMAGPKHEEGTAVAVHRSERSASRLYGALALLIGAIAVAIFLWATWHSGS